MIKFLNKDLEEIPELLNETDMSIEEAINKSYAVPIWKKKDEDDNVLLISVHNGGFLISIEGDNYVNETAGSEAYTETWFDFKMLSEIGRVMEKYKYLVSEDS